MSPGPRDVKGLTLVEVLVAVSILVTVSASTFLIFRGITRAWRTGTLRTDRYQQGRLLCDLFERELTSSVANVRYPLIGAPASGASALVPGARSDAVFFVGALPGRSGFVERGYWVDASGQLICHDDEPADGDYATGSADICGHDITGFVAVYFDGQQWLERWDGRPDGAHAGWLPKAVKITITVGRQSPETFETVIHVPAS
jgi:prepilin-type N-terminal cleavage/methylation domain-containing protein